MDSASITRTKPWPGPLPVIPWPGATLHLALCAMVLAGCLILAPATPRDGQGVLLVPLHGGAASGFGAVLDRPGITVTGRGPLAGSLVIRVSGALSPWSLLRRGILPLAAPGLLCGQPDAMRPPPPGGQQSRRSRWMN